MIGLHITKDARNAKIIGCDFYDRSIKNEGNYTTVMKSCFHNTSKNVGDWSSKWWGQIVVGLVVVMIGYYIFGIK